MEHSVCIIEQSHDRVVGRRDNGSSDMEDSLLHMYTHTRTAFETVRIFA